MLIELRSGFCDPSGELLGVVARPEWQRLTRARLPREGARPRHIIGYWHAPGVSVTERL